MAIPAFGLGTFRLKDDVVISSVKTTLELGYRAIDTAQIYDNEAAVGQAIAESGCHVMNSTSPLKSGLKISAKTN